MEETDFEGRLVPGLTASRDDEGDDCVGDGGRIWLSCKLFDSCPAKSSTSALSLSGDETMFTFIPS